MYSSHLGTVFTSDSMALNEASTGPLPSDWALILSAVAAEHHRRVWALTCLALLGQRDELEGIGLLMRVLLGHQGLDVLVEESRSCGRPAP